MAVDKLVDSTQLNADLTSVANAIRTKGGTSAQMAFPNGFVNAVNAIPTGGSPTGTKQITITENGTTTEDVAAYANAEITVNVQGGGGSDTLYEWAENTLTTYENTRLTNLRPSGMRGSGSALQRISLPNLETAEMHAFRENSCSSYYLPKLRIAGTACFQSNPNITTLVFPSWTNPRTADDLFRSCTALSVVDFGENATQLGRYNVFTSDANLKTLILRNSNLVVLNSTGIFTSTPFASNGTGGTIYIPEALYDHLGDGTALDYKAATNWSTIDGYGTITWAQIEGSIYETQYADGTPVT